MTSAAAATERAAIPFPEVLAAKRQAIWEVVQSYLEDVWAPAIASYAGRSPELAAFHQRLVTEYPRRRGKYLRPALVLLTCEALGGAPRRALPTAAAIQLCEDWLLVHDDCEDGSPKRRGEKALHRLYGRPLAINAGDALHMLMWRVLQDNFALMPADLARQIMQEFYELLTRTAFGQTVELKWTSDNMLDLTTDDWFFLAKNKTAYYTVVGPMRLGALVGGATPAQLEAIRRFAVLLGQSFQIVDDVLDLVCDFDGLKGPEGGDIVEGKRTLMLIHLLNSAAPADREAILAVLRKPGSRKTRHDVAHIIRLMHEYGSIAYARRVAGDLATAAITMFETELTFLASEPAREQLRSGIEFILARHR